MRRVIAGVGLVILAGANLGADEPAEFQLQREIEAVLQQTGTRGAAIAVVRRDGPEWIAGVGLANVATGRPATADSLFRIGSTSKMFVALAVLKLQEEGLLNLNDTLRSRAPDLEFVNAWEKTDPIRIVHLLEHTTGWDDLGLRDYAFDPEQETTLEEGLALRPHHRVSTEARKTAASEDERERRARARIQRVV